VLLLGQLEKLKCPLWLVSLEGELRGIEQRADPCPLIADPQFQMGELVQVISGVSETASLPLELGEPDEAPALQRQVVRCAGSLQGGQQGSASLAEPPLLGEQRTDLDRDLGLQAAIEQAFGRFLRLLQQRIGGIEIPQFAQDRDLAQERIDHTHIVTDAAGAARCPAVELACGSEVRLLPGEIA
jgi:hypothetical protein